MILLFSFFLLSGMVIEILALFLMRAGLSIFLGLSLLLIASYCIVFAIDQYKSFYRFYTTSIRFLFFLIVFFLPILGILGALCMVRWLWKAQHHKPTPRIRDVILSNSPKPLRNTYGVGGLRTNLQSTELAIENRLDALKTLSILPPRKINNLIRTVLPDTNEEVRLLAFHILNKQEKSIIPEINKALKLLQEEKSFYKKAKLQKWLAFEYWELVYRHLVEPSLMHFILMQVIHYIKLAQIYFQNDASLWFLLGRAHFHMQQFEEASESFAQAITNGAAKNRILPYLAEIYFYQRQFSAIKLLLTSHLSISNEPYSALVEFWGETC